MVSFRWQTGFGGEESARHRPFEEGAFLRGIDLDAGIDVEQWYQAAGVVAVAMGDDDCVDPGQVDAKFLHVVLEYGGAVARIEQDALAVVFQE